MGALENQARKNQRKKNIQKGILMAVATAGLLSVALVAPNVLKVLGKRPDKFFKYNANKSRDRLLEDSFIIFEEKKGKKYLKLTEKGDRKLREWGVVGYHIDKPKRWDKKWRILTFDIWERRRYVRDKLRLVLRRIGFYQMQRSVWVYPYDCEDFIQLLKADFKVGSGMLYVIADQIENDKVLRKHFKFPIT